MRATGELFRTLVGIGYPFALVVVWGGNPDVIKKYYGKTLSLNELLDVLEEAKPIDIRLKTTFDPIDFNNPYSWSAWGYPLKTLVREIELDKLTKYKYKILPPNEYCEYASYFGLAIVTPKGKIYGYIILEPRIPRKILVLIPKDGKIYAYTGDKGIADVLLRLGYEHVRDGEYVVETRDIVGTLRKTFLAVKRENMLYRVFMPRYYSRIVRANLLVLTE